MDFGIKPFENSEAMKSIQHVSAENEEIRRMALISTAEVTAQYIYHSILDFSLQIGEEHDVGLQVSTLGTGVKVYLSDLSYHNPHLIIFGSEDQDGTKIRIVQHITQLNYALIAILKPEQEKPKRKIGFSQE